MSDLILELRMARDRLKLLTAYGEDAVWRPALAAHLALEKAIVSLQSLSDQNRLTGGWRDIESAPKDGTLILLYGDTPDGPRVTAGNWLAPEHGDYLGDCGGECRCPEYGDPPEPLWWDTDGGFTDEWPPLGWQPLPSPPLPLPGGDDCSSRDLSSTVCGDVAKGSDPIQVKSCG